MKNLILLLSLLSLPTLASHEVGVGYQRIQQNLVFEEDIKFPMDAIAIGYSYYHESGLGFRASVSRSTVTGNSSYVTNNYYQNKVNALYQAQVAYKYSVTDNFHMIAAYGATEYHTTWWVNGVEPHWSKGTDTGKGASYGFQLDFNKNLTWEVTAGKPYDKMKEGYGREQTYVITSMLSYRFN